MPTSSPLLLIATTTGLIVSDSSGREQVHTLTGQHVTSVIAREGVILAGTTDGVRRSDDLGRSWIDASRGLSHRYVNWMAFHPDISDLELAGTRAGIYVSLDGAHSWRPLTALTTSEFPWRDPLSAGEVTGVTTLLTSQNI